jgi:hypothetical protein
MANAERTTEPGEVLIWFTTVHRHGFHISEEEALSLYSELGTVLSPQVSSPEELARLFHETYERLAPEYGYKTREASAVPWDDVPAQNKSLMIAVAAHVLSKL